MGKDKKKKAVEKLAKASIKATKKEIKTLKEMRATIDRLIKERTKHTERLQK